MICAEDNAEQTKLHRGCGQRTSTDEATHWLTKWVSMAWATYMSPPNLDRIESGNTTLQLATGHTECKALTPN
jgi:hypothetical protein